MPYTSKDKEKIMKKYDFTEHEAEIFISAFNSAFEKYGEERAFKIAHSAVNKYQAKRKKKKKVSKAFTVQDWLTSAIEGAPEPDDLGEVSAEEDAFAEGFASAYSILRTEDWQESYIEGDKTEKTGDTVVGLKDLLGAIAGDSEARFTDASGTEGKVSTLISANGMALLCAESEPGGEVYIAIYDRLEQDEKDSPVHQIARKLAEEGEKVITLRRVTPLENFYDVKVLKTERR